MSRKIFVSYKYGDAGVQPLVIAGNDVTTARHYVNVLEILLDAGDQIYKGENDGESLASFTDETIESKLRTKIFDSSTTVVLVSPNMKNPFATEADQWIPWEISWSLRQMTRGDRTSGTNAMLAVVLPDQYGRYDYFVQENTCAVCNCRTLQTHMLFKIMQGNMFNRRKPIHSTCGNHAYSKPHIGDDHSYIYPVKWSDFIGNIGWYIERAHALRERLDEYDLAKTV